MKRLCALLTALLLTACGAPAEPPQTGDGPPVGGQTQAGGAESAKPPFRLDELNVEFAAAGRDTDALLSLRADFPWALTDALERQGVTVGSVNVTFGTSGEATVSAMRSGMVQLAFLPAEDYYPYRTGILVAVEEGVTPDLSLGLLVTAATEDPAADERLADALRAALPDLAPALASYTGTAAKGRYSSDLERLEQLSLLYEQSRAADSRGANTGPMDS